MTSKVTLKTESKLSLDSKTTIKFDEKHEFIVNPLKDSDGKKYFIIEDVKGDIEITSVKMRFYYGFAGRKGDYMFQHLCGNPVKDVNVCLSFIFESTASPVIYETGHNVTKNIESAKVPSNDTTKRRGRKFSATENDKEDSQPLPKKFKQDSSKWYEIMSNKQYSDVTLISSDDIKIPSHRCVLSKHSQIFAKIIDETSELPITINIEGFNAEIIQAALDFNCFILK
uniref:BTB domain-containing protein n=1 Tax=Panagrolaimus davidi TaxID=227884 RepID=A0A914P779_9BILA